MAQSSVRVPEQAVTQQNVEDLVQSLLAMETEALTEEQEALLSKALFPETHTSEITVLGKKRELRPLTIKYARKVNAGLKKLQSNVTEAVETNSSVKVDEDMLESFVGVVLILCEYYGWTDIRDKVESEDIDNSDLMLICMTQQNVQGTNDFLLMPLRLLLKVAQLHELLAVKLARPKR